MRRSLVLLIVLVAPMLLPLEARAHCDAIDGPVATAAREALEANNVNVVLPYAPATAEAELTAAFRQTVVVRAKDADARALADRYFMETAVRLHRTGENAPYTGLKPAGTDFGPAIAAAERALAAGSVDAVTTLIRHAVEHGIAERFARVHATVETSKAPATSAGVAAARERVRAELDFIGYIEAVYQATRGAGHVE